ncbi:MAG: DUF4097 family beta strand repeat-containing protein [Balneolaceae bacterium]
MKKILLTLTLLLTASTIFAQSGKKDGEFNASGVDELSIQIDAGMEISVTGTNSNTIKFEYDFDGNDEAYEHYFQNFNPEFDRSSGRARLIIDFPDQKKRRVNHRIKKHSLIISVPQNLALDLSSRYSEVTVTNIEKGVSIQNRSGEVKVIDVQQLVRINNQYGRIDVSNINGDIVLSNRSANVDVKNVVGRLEVDANYSKLNISKVDGEVFISNRSGTVNIFEIKGNLVTNGPYVEYEITNIEGDVEISNRNGKVVLDTARSLKITGDYTYLNASNILSTQGVYLEGRSANIVLENIGGPASITGQYLDMTLKNIDGPATIRNRSGKVNIDGLEEYLSMHGEYIPLDVRNFKGESVQIVNRSGSTVIEALNTLNLIDIESQYGKVELTMKKEFNGEVTIESKYGKVISDLTLTTQNISTSNNERLISGVAGNGSGRMIIKNRNGDIIIKQ